MLQLVSLLVILALNAFGNNIYMGQSYMEILRNSEFFPKDQKVVTTNPTICCLDYSCPNPCYPVAYPMSMPIVLQAQTVFEPVIHNHPPLHVIKKIIKADKKKWKKHSSNEDSSYTDTDTSNSDSNTDYD